jgi:hypothetical protein
MNAAFAVTMNKMIPTIFGWLQSSERDLLNVITLRQDRATISTWSPVLRVHNSPFDMAQRGRIRVLGEIERSLPIKVEFHTLF